MGVIPGSSVHGIFQARVLEWGAIAFSDKLYKNTYIVCWRERFLLASQDAKGPWNCMGNSLGIINN